MLVPESGASACVTNGARSQVCNRRRVEGWSGGKAVNIETETWSDNKFMARASFQLVLPSV